MPAYRKRLSEEQKRRIVELYERGVGTASIARRLGVEQYSINYVLRKARREGPKAVR